ncbi:MAG: transporter [Eubacteriales bacterium]|nr:transporter [Eubacteriales bacterium]
MNRQKFSELKPMLLLHGTLLLYAVVSVFGKLAGIGMSMENTSMTFTMLGLELLTLAVYSVLWQQVLKRMPLHFAYSNKGVCTLWTCMFGILFFGEALTWGKAAGILVVLIGVWLVVTDHE